MAERDAAPDPPILALAGPTASGKSAVAEWLSERLPLELISVDSGQVYRGLDIGTAKPDRATRERCRYHLIDVVEPEQSYSAARFVQDAEAAIVAVRAQGRVPLLVGGTMLYLRAFERGLSPLPEADPALRARLGAELNRFGSRALHRRLAALDPLAAARIHPNDPQRLLRALEVYALTGRPLSALQRGGAARRRNLHAWVWAPSERAWLHARIAERFDAMLAAGLIAEVEALRRRPGLSPELPSMRTVGYRQVWAHLDGAYDRAELRDRAIYATRQLAKRQLTWLRQERRWTWIEADRPESPAKLARALEAVLRGGDAG